MFIFILYYIILYIIYYIMYYMLYIILYYIIYSNYGSYPLTGLHHVSYTHICQHNIHLYLSYVHCLFALLSLTFICPLCLWFIVTHLICPSALWFIVILLLFVLFVYLFLHVSTMYSVHMVIPPMYSRWGCGPTVHRNRPDGSSREGVPVWSSSGCDLSGPTVSTRHRERVTHSNSC